jgi:hypothetical protein
MHCLYLFIGFPTIEQELAVVRLKVPDLSPILAKQAVELVHTLRKMDYRSYKMIWLNPESPSLWGQGDSDMLKYGAFCDIVIQVSNLAELTAAIDRLLS